MKKLNLFAVGLIAMLAASSVNAQDVNNTEALEDCLSKDNTCTLTQDISSVGNTYIELSGKVATIDLNNHTLTLDHNISVKSGTGTRGGLTVKNGTIDVKTSNGSGILAEEGTDLTIDGVVFKDSSTVSGTNPSLIQITGGTNQGTLVVKNSKFDSKNTGIGIFPKASQNVSNVKVSITNTEITSVKFAMSVNGLVKGEDPRPEITLSGNTFTSKETAAIYAAGTASWTIDSGNYKGADAMSIRSGKFTITGGTFEATGAYVVTPSNTTGHSVSTGSAITVASSQNSDYAKNVELNIDGGTFKAAEGLAIYEVITTFRSALKSISITDGTFEAGENCSYVVYVSNADVKNYISGGSYSGGTKKYTNKDDALATDLSSMTGSDGVTVIGKQYKVTVKNLTAVDGVTSYTKPESFDAVEGARINVLQKLNLNAENVPKDLNYQYGVRYVITTKDGKKITGLDEFTMPGSDVEIDLEIVEVRKDTYEDTKGEDVTPSTPGTDPTPGEPTDPSDPERDPEAGEKDPSEELPNNQPTGDNVMGSVAMGIAGLVGIVGSALVFDKKTNYNN